MTVPILAPAVGPITAARAYLRAQLDERDNPLPVDVTAPPGPPTSYALLSRPGRNDPYWFVGDYMIRLRVFDVDSERGERNADLLHGILLSARHRKISTTEGDVWITNALHQYGPASFDDPDVRLFGMQSAVFWTIGHKIK